MMALWVAKCLRQHILMAAGTKTHSFRAHDSKTNKFNYIQHLNIIIRPKCYRSKCHYNQLSKQNLKWIKLDQKVISNLVIFAHSMTELNIWTIKFYQISRMRKRATSPMELEALITNYLTISLAIKICIAPRLMGTVRTIPILQKVNKANPKLTAVHWCKPRQWTQPVRVLINNNHSHFCRHKVHKRIQISIFKVIKVAQLGFIKATAMERYNTKLRHQSQQ